MDGVLIMYEIFFTNFGHAAGEAFDTLKEAIAYGRSKGFEFSVFYTTDYVNEMVGYAKGPGLSFTPTIYAMEIH
jgi:hypothetical protein